MIWLNIKKTTKLYEVNISYGKKRFKVTVLWLFAGIISFLFSFAMIVDWEYQSAIMRVIGALAPFLGIFFFKLLKDSLLGKKSSEPDKELLPTYIGATLRDCFFVECVLSSCNDFTKKKNELHKFKIIRYITKSVLLPSDKRKFNSFKFIGLCDYI